MSKSRGIERNLAAALGREAVLIARAGRYTGPSGLEVSVREGVEAAVAGTTAYPPATRVHGSIADSHETRFDVMNQTTLVAARRLVDAGERPAALNFASARHPGGGFLNGARAQEESLARSSALYACLEGQAMYSDPVNARDAMYGHWVIYSPDVPVFRTDDGGLLDEPWPCTFLTSPAVNAKVVLERDPSRAGAIRETMLERIRKVLAVALRHGHSHLVLGAWGCGAFGNDPEEIAPLFHSALTNSFRGAFARVVFAVLDRSEGEKIIGPFRRAFGR